MTEQWRYVCPRCGSRSVRDRGNGLAWWCGYHEGMTPAVYDLKEDTWDHVGRDAPEESVPSGLGRSRTVPGGAD